MALHNAFTMFIHSCFMLCKYTCFILLCSKQCWFELMICLYFGVYIQVHCGWVQTKITAEVRRNGQLHLQEHNISFFFKKINKFLRTPVVNNKNFHVCAHWEIFYKIHKLTLLNSGSTHKTSWRNRQENYFLNSGAFLL